MLPKYAFWTSLFLSSSESLTSIRSDWSIWQWQIRKLTKHLGYLVKSYGSREAITLSFSAWCIPVGAGIFRLLILDDIPSKFWRGKTQLRTFATSLQISWNFTSCRTLENGVANCNVSLTLWPNSSLSKSTTYRTPGNESSCKWQFQYSVDYQSQPALNHNRKYNLTNINSKLTAYMFSGSK